MSTLQILGIITGSIFLFTIFIYFIHYKLKKYRLSEWRVGDELTFLSMRTNQYDHAKKNPLTNTKWREVTVRLLRWDMSKIEVEYGDGSKRTYDHNMFNDNLDYDNRNQDDSFEDFMDDINVSPNIKKLKNRKSIIERILNKQ